jgi:hypothetical protein
MFTKSNGQMLAETTEYKDIDATVTCNLRQLVQYVRAAKTAQAILG